MKKFLCLAVVAIACVMAGCKDYDSDIADINNCIDEIWYTTTDGYICTPKNANAFGAKIISNNYQNGRGVIKFDGAVTSIGTTAFSGCRSLTSITIPGSVTSIGDGAFRDCSSLVCFYGPHASLDNRCIIIDGQLVAFAPNGLTTYIIPEGVTSIGDGTFENCNSLTSITIPDSVTSIGEYAFNHCNSLTSITIPDSVTSIGDSAFEGCRSLTNITIPKGVTSIGHEAFYSCSEALKVYSKPTTPPEVGYLCFDVRSVDIYVPRESLDSYKSSWSEYNSHIYAYDFE